MILDADFSQAIARAREFTDARPDLATSWATLALVQAERAGESDNPALRDQAKASARRAAAIAPDKAMTRLAIVAAIGDTSPIGLPILESTLHAYPNDPNVLRQLSVVLFNLGYVKASVEPALQAIRTDPTWLGGRDIAVRRLAAAGRIDEATRLQGENERLWPGHPQIIEQRIRLIADGGTVDDVRRLMTDHGLTAENIRGPGAWVINGSLQDEIVKLERQVGTYPYEAYMIARLYERIGDRRSSLAWLNRAPATAVHQQWSLLFWPDARGLRTEPAFFKKMAALDLVRWWVARGEWPDFCSEPGLKYDCAQEAAKLGFKPAK